MSNLLIVVVLLAAACTKPNPNRCCTDEADCNAKGIPVGSTCEAGLVCRGNQCISEPCTSAADCEPSAPYCVAELCAERCNDDTHCPGFGQSADQRFCVLDTCQACRVGMNDCGDSVPICDSGGCRPCREHAECASGVCASDGRCADGTTVAYVTTSGSGTSDCTLASPCNSVSRALTMMRPYVVIGAGTFASSATLLLAGQVRLIGAGATVLTRSTAGAIVTVGSGQLGIEDLEISGATRPANDYGDGIFCSASGGAPMLQLRRVTVRDNADTGLHTVSCAATVDESTFANNGGAGLWISNGTGIIDRSVAIGNSVGMDLDSGLYQVTNSFILRNDSSTNASYGINLYSTEPGNRIEFNTIADNAKSSTLGAGFNCNLQGITASFPNNILVRNRIQTAGTNCSYPGSLVADTDVAPLKFKSPDAAPYDYHITAGSIAIDAATQSTLDHDFDGEPRTAPRDVGADEFVP